MPAILVSFFFIDSAFYYKPALDSGEVGSFAIFAVGGGPISFRVLCLDFCYCVIKRFI